MAETDSYKIIDQDDHERAIVLNSDDHVTIDGTPSTEDALLRVLERCLDDGGLRKRLGVSAPLSVSAPHGYEWTITTSRVADASKALMAVDRTLKDGMGNTWHYSNDDWYWIKHPGRGNDLAAWTSDAIRRWMNALTPEVLAAVEDYLRTQACTLPKPTIGMGIAKTS